MCADLCLKLVGLGSRAMCGVVTRIRGADTHNAIKLDTDLFAWYLPVSASMACSAVFCYERVTEIRGGGGVWFFLVLHVDVRLS